MDLPNEANVLVAKRGGLGFVEGGDVLASVEDGARGSAVKSA